MKWIARMTVVMAIGAGGSAIAQTGYECTSGDLLRRIEIVYSGDAAVPCEVQYVKETEAPGTRETLWDAQNESGFCEARAQELVTRLQSLGWSCSAGDAMPAADDSAVLTPQE